MTRTSTLRLSGEFIAESTSGDLVLGSGLYAEGGASIDSRTAGTGEVFFAIQGPRFDGHEYLLQAVERGCAGLVVRRGRETDAMRAAAANPARVFIVAVDDTETALARTAAAWVEVLSPIVVALTGSVGKTTTKDLVRAVSSSDRETLATVGNRNNRLGLSLTCLRLLPSHEVLVVEMGMNHPGEIADLCRIAPPRVGIVTMVAAVHLEGMGTLEAVAEAKAELVRALPPHGTAVLNGDDPRVAAMRSLTTAHILTFGTVATADVRIESVELDSDGRASVTFEIAGAFHQTRLSLVGAHHAMNAAAAVAAGMAVGIAPEKACAALGAVTPGRHRMEVVSAGTIRILDDCYNASPKSLRAALDALVAVSGGRRVAILGDMLELGEATEDAHLDAGRAAARAGVGLLIAVGRQAGLIRRAAVEAGVPSGAVFETPDAIAAATVAQAVVVARDTVLVKGSRGVGLELVVEGLAARFKQGVSDTGN